MTSETIKYHGIVFSRIVRGVSSTTIRQYPSKSSSSYVVAGTGVFIKYSTKRLSPWQFSFTRQHQQEVKDMYDDLKRVVIVLVCGDDGIVALNYLQTKQLLDTNFEDCERISVRRPPRGKYRVSGTDGSLKNTIGDNEFPNKVFSLQ